MKVRTVAWLVLGALIAIIAIPISLKAQVIPPPAVAKTPAALSKDLAFARFIALIRGHLLTSDELAGQGQWEAAASHAGFPREEVYGIIRDDLRNYKTPPFDDALKALVRAAKARNAAQYAKARKSVEDSLAAADAALKAKAANWPRFVVAVAIEVLKTAPDEYDDAIGTGRNLGRIARPIGYQTARGFILQADRMFESVAGELSGGNAAALSDIRAGFAQLKQAFASVAAPKHAPIDYAAVLSIVSKMEAAAAKLV
jgi:hypothetical protein